MSNPIIKKYEDLYLKAYKCPAGVWTIGWGTTEYPDGTKVKKFDEITEEQAEGFLNHYINEKIKLVDNLSLNQRTALEALIYNIGHAEFDNSSLKKAIIAKDLKGIYKNWDWISITVKDKKTGKSYKKALRGLCRRRSEELNLFMEDKL